jgi:outer membrane protein TolC
MQKKNIELAEEVYRVSKIKYENGVGTNLEVLNAETSLKEAQINYFNALYDAMVLKVDFDKAKGTLTK